MKWSGRVFTWSLFLCSFHKNVYTLLFRESVVNREKCVVNRGKFLSVSQCSMRMEGTASWTEMPLRCWKESAVARMELYAWNEYNISIGILGYKSRNERCNKHEEKSPFGLYMRFLRLLRMHRGKYRLSYTSTEKRLWSVFRSVWKRRVKHWFWTGTVYIQWYYFDI